MPTIGMKSIANGLLNLENKIQSTKDKIKEFTELKDFQSVFFLKNELQLLEEIYNSFYEE